MHKLIHTGYAPTLMEIHPFEYPQWDEAAFWSLVDCQGEQDCWEFQGIRLPSGYGRQKMPRSPEYQGKKAPQQYAHRMAFGFVHNWTPPVVRHTCDHPWCVNPAHLLPGTMRENTEDSIERGRFARVGAKGEKNGNAKLTTDTVRAIRAALASGAKGVDLAKLYGVNKNTIYKVKSGRQWGHVQ